MSEELRKRLHLVIFEADTPEGKSFDVILLIAIALSVLIVMMESVPSINARYEWQFDLLEWIFTGLFTIEYILRIWAIKRPWRYIFSFYGIVDLLAVLPTYLSILFVGTESLLVIRSLRLIRIFRVLKLTRYIGQANVLMRALSNSRHKIMVFLFVVVTVTFIMGTIMYLVEGPANGFSSIPMSIYWTIVTLTTVGYGDISPATPLGQFIASFIMILGYGIIAVPTGIVTAELARGPVATNTQACQNCGEDHHQDSAKYCHSCGHPLE